jgi:hypothetical protein
MTRAEEICHHILLWRSRDQKTSQLMSRIKKAEADALAKNQADAKAREDSLKQAKQATNDGAFAKARGLCNRVLAEDPENDEAMDLLPEIDKAEAKARERAETEKQAREAKIDEAMQVLDQKDLARAVEISRAAVLQNPSDDKARALLQQIGKVAIERITELTTASLMSGNITSKDLQALLAQANVLARDAGAGVSTATLSNMLTSLAVFVTPRQQEPPESIPATSLTDEPSPFAPGTSPGMEPTASPSVSSTLAGPESPAKGATTGTISSAALGSGVPAESSAATTTPTLSTPTLPTEPPAEPVTSPTLTTTGTSTSKAEPGGTTRLVDRTLTATRANEPKISRCDFADKARAEVLVPHPTGAHPDETRAQNIRRRILFADGRQEAGAPNTRTCAVLREKLCQT